tara:strand:- start:165 stop:479 length:315 start_codon:yes stop_codon:yes gene_type:complete
MATTHKKLSSGQLGSSTATIYDPSSVTGMVKTIVLHNTNTTDEDVEVYFDGTTAADKMLEVTLQANETFEWSVGHMVVVLDAETLKGTSTTASKVNYFIFGAEE